MSAAGWRTAAPRPDVRAVALGAALAATLLPGAATTAAPLTAVIDTAQRSEPVTRYEYGMFIEPIGGLIARSLWAEMLDDRKFYYPVVAAGQDAPAEASGPAWLGITVHPWRPVGAPDAVTMDRTDPFVGAQSAAVAVSGAAPRGLGQGGLTIASGRRYVGHVVLDAAAGVPVQVVLVWGTGAAERRVLATPAPGAGWRSTPFEFVSPIDSSDARLEITGTGAGRFRVGAASLMPADNIHGWRADTTQLLRELHSGFWRLPGGNFLSNWDWHGALGPRDRRAPMFDHAWNATQANDLGMDEYLELTRIIGVEPYVTVNAGLGDANSAAEEVAYLNGAADSEWGAKRAANGHAEPYGVRYWNIGNEPYGWWQIGRTSLEYFMIKHNEFAAAMRAADPSIVLIGSGAMPDQLHPKDAQENPSLDGIRHKFGTEEDWTGGLLANAWGNFDGVSEHWYDKAESRPGAPPGDELLEFARSPSNQVRFLGVYLIINQRGWPAPRDRQVFLAIDEFAYIGAPADLKLALAYSLVLQEMLRWTDFLTMSAFTTGVSTLDITPNGAVRNATGEVFALYGAHFGAGTVPLRVDGNSPQPAPRYPVGFDHPQVRAGSATFPLDVIAGLSPDRRSLRIAIVNATLQPQVLHLDLRGAQVRGRGVLWRLTGARLDAANTAGQPPGVTTRQDRAPLFVHGLTVPPISTSIYEYPLAHPH